MLHSLRLRLILVTTILPMVTIAAAGFLIRDANAETFSNAAGFSFTSAVPDGTLEARRLAVTGEQGRVSDPVGPGLAGAGEIAVSNAGVPVGGACLTPFTAEISALPPTIRKIGEDAIPYVYGGRGGGFVVVADEKFLPAFEQQKESSLSSLNLRVASVIGSAGLLCGVVGFLASQRILQPVTALTSAARRLEAGDLRQRVEHEGRDEIGQLSHAFNSMAESLDRTETLRKTMTSDIAHELRTPLNNIAGFVDMLSDGLVEPDARVLSTLQEETQLLVTLVDDLEQLSLGDAGQLRLEKAAADPSEMVERAMHAMAPRATERGVSLSYEAPAGLVVNADVSRLDQVLRNLLENAIRHAPRGGEVRAAVSQAEGSVEIVVDDNGPGIDHEHLPYIFERFYRADSSRTRHTGGSGLGLAIARQIVEAHGGSVTAENRSEGGARFIASLPAG